MKRFYHNTANRTVRAESIECSTTGKGKTAQHTFSLDRTDVSANEARRWSGPVGEHADTFYGDPKAKAQGFYENKYATKNADGWVEIDEDEYKTLSKEYADEYAAQNGKR